MNYNTSAPSLRPLRERFLNSKSVMLTPQGPVLTAEEMVLYSEHQPFGFCLFAKHCENPDQLRALCDDLRDAAGETCVIAIDQEGGRVARMCAPTWKNFPAAANMDDVYQTYFDLGTMLADHGIDMNFAPCLDVVPTGGQCDAIGDRCFSSDPDICGQKGVEACRGLIDAGIMPVMKHMPGHGRAVEDSHFFLPHVTANEGDLLNDLKSFQAVTKWDTDAQIGGMTAHVLYDAWDVDHPATLSDTIIKNIIRGEIGFEGLLFSDDLAMKALDRYGDVVTRVKLSLEAGCDIALPCHTSLVESRKILESL